MRKSSDFSGTFRLLTAMAVSWTVVASASGAHDAETLIAVVASPDSTWEERSAAEKSLAQMPREVVLPKLVPVLRDQPDGDDRAVPENAEGDKDAPPAWLAYYSTWRVWQRARPSDVDPVTPELKTLAADLLPLSRGIGPRVEVARLSFTFWSDRAEEPLAVWLRDGRAPDRVRNEAAKVLLRHRYERYFSEIRGLLDSASPALKEQLFRTILSSRRENDPPDPLVTSTGFELLERALSQKQFPAAVHDACLLEQYVGERFSPEAANGHPRNAVERQSTIDKARAWWKVNGERIQKDAAKLRPRDV